MPLKFSPIPGCRFVYNGLADVIPADQSRVRDDPANPSLAFTYHEVMAVHNLIKANSHGIKLVSHVSTKAFHNGSGHLIGAFETKRGDLSGASVFFLQKDVIPGEPTFYEGVLFNTNWMDKENFETYNFDVALRMIRIRLERENISSQTPSAPSP